MTQEQIQQSLEKFNTLSIDEKQEVWNSAIDRLSKVNLEELSNFDATAIDGGSASSSPARYPWPLYLPYVIYM